MSKEFEAKVLLTADEFIQFMTKNQFVCNSSKEDEYWSKYSSTEEAIKNGESLTRTRKSENGCWYLTLKNKKNQNGFEDNVELETKFSDKKVLEKLLTEAGYHPYFSKYKRSWLMCNNKSEIPSSIITNVELEIIENSKSKEDPNYKCFYALEVECVVNNFDFSEDYLSSLIKNIFKNYGKTEEDFETRSWFELLS